MGASTSFGRYAKEHLTNETKPDPWTDLANAVVAQAADDYRRLCNKKVKYGATMTDLEWNIVNGEISSIASFFRSDWGFLLSHGLAPTILEKLTAEYAERMKAMLEKREKMLAERERTGNDAKWKDNSAYLTQSANG